jgi:hypothetical protein
VLKARSKKQRKKARQQDRAINPPPTLVGALKTREACAYLGGLHPASLARLVKRGLIRPNKMLRHNTYPITELDRALEEGLV